MKKHLPLCLLLLLLFMGSGCKKEMLDFSRLDQASASGEWGIPILNATYTIEDILLQLGNNDYISQDANGQLFLNYIFDEKRIVTDSTILSFSNTSSSYRWREVIAIAAGSTMTKDTTFLFKIPDDNIIIRRGTVMHGYLDLAISGNIETVVVSSQSIRDASGRNFIRTISGNYQEKIDLSGYSVSFSYEDTNKIAIDVHIIYQGTGATKEYYMNMNVSSQNLRLREVTGKMKPFTGRYTDMLDIGKFLDRNHSGGSLTLFNPKVTVHIKNSFNRIEGVAFIDTLHFMGQNTSSHILTAYPSTIQVLAGMNAEQDVQGLSSVFFSSLFDKLKFAGHVIVNPLGFSAGELSIQENSALDIKANLGIPFEVKTDNLYYRDTVNFNLGDSLNMGKTIQNIVFRYVIGNKLPFNVNTQIYFYNSRQQVLVDSLFYPHLSLAGTFKEGDMVETAALLEIEQNRINKVLTADKIIFQVKINTNGRTVFVNAKHGVKAVLGVKIKYETDDLFHVFN